VTENLIQNKVAAPYYEPALNSFMRSGSINSTPNSSVNLIYTGVKNVNLIYTGVKFTIVFGLKEKTPCHCDDYAKQKPLKEINGKSETKDNNDYKHRHKKL